MLKKGFRLRKKEDFDRVFRSGKPLFFDEIGCRYVIGRTTSFKIGFSLSKKYLTKAVERNRFRRIFSEAFSSLAQNWPKDAEIIIFLVKRPKKVDKDTAKLLVSAIFSKISHKKEKP